MKIGILGGGQLAQMMALAGHPLGFEFIFIDPAEDACAHALGEHHVSDWSGAHLVEVLEGADRVTFDFENVPADTLALLNDQFVVRPSPKALEVSQDRWHEKTLFESLGLAVAPFYAVDTRPDLIEGLARVGFPALLKTRRLGYDGKGQYLIRDREDLEPAWQSLGGVPLILEGFVPFSHECALTAVRNAKGDVRFYALTHTHHQQGILRFALSPSPANQAWQMEAQTMVQAVLEALDYVGTLTVELFVTEQGLVINEMAPRVHNSAHWTIEGAVCSQFENHLRALADLPLGSTESLGVSLMINFVGQMPAIEMLQLPGLHWHDYGKQARAGRKVGHATWVAPSMGALTSHLDELLPFLDREQVQGLGELIKAAG